MRGRAARAASRFASFCMVLGLMILLLGVAPPMAYAQTHLCGPGTVTEFGRWFDPNVSLSSAHATDTVAATIAGQDVSGMKLLVSVAPGASRNWNVVIRDSGLREIVSMGSRDFPGDHPQSRWTGILKLNPLIVDLIAEPDSDVKVTFAEGIAFPGNSPGRLFSIVNPDHPWQDLFAKNTSAAAKRAGDAVGMLVGAYSSSGRSASWCCTGFMISADVMLTNWHCGGSTDLNMADADYWSPAVCTNTIVDLNWATGATSRKFQCVQVLASDKALDFAAIRLGPVLGPDGAEGEPVHVRLASGAPIRGQGVFLIHHSQCMQKLVSNTCQVKSESRPGWTADATTEQSDFTHNCNTETGASGAPIFNADGLVIGLHHLGASGSESTCQVSAGENDAVKISAIVAFIKSYDSALARELGFSGN
jgi:hypothetical protein